MSPHVQLTIFGFRAFLHTFGICAIIVILKAVFAYSWEKYVQKFVQFSRNSVSKQYVGSILLKTFKTLGFKLKINYKFFVIYASKVYSFRK